MRGAPTAPLYRHNRLNKLPYRKIEARFGVAPLQTDVRPTVGRSMALSAGSYIAVTKAWVGFLAALAPLVTFETAYSAEARHALAMHGEPALPADFARLPYVNPDAPKGGRFTRGVLGTFDSLNPLII